MQGLIDQLVSIFEINFSVITPVQISVTLLTSLITGFLISMLYIKTYNGNFYNKSFPLSLIILNVVISVLIIVIGNNIARAFSLAGSLSIIRFRSALRDPKDIAYIFFTMAAGLSCGAGFFIPALIFVIVLGIVIVFATKFDYGNKKNDSRILKVILPEDVSFEDIFEDIFNEYLLENKLLTVRTSGLGTLYEISWSVKLKKEISVKKFLDDLRTRNNNLKVSLLLNYDMYDDNKLV